MNIVCIGGGHGLSRVLSSVSTIASSLTAVVTTTDNGGSTGRLRQDSSQIALGDIRRCINNLASPHHLLAKLGEQRFESNNDLHGHCFGNLMLSALCQTEASPTEAIIKYSGLLSVQHLVLPMSDTPVDLVATLRSGHQVVGECGIDGLDEFPASIKLSKVIQTTALVRDAINQADVIIIGPGSLLTSVLPPLLVPGIACALRHSAACRIYIENLVPEGSVVDLIPQQMQVYKIIELLGYKFFDLSFSSQGLLAMDLKSVAKNEKRKTHRASQLQRVIGQLLPKSKLMNFSEVSKLA